MSVLCNHNTILTAMVANFSVTLIPPSPQLDLRQIEHQSTETTRHHICICHVVLIGLGQELDLHLPLQCNSEFATREKSNSSAITRQVATRLLQERPLQFQHGNVCVKSWPTLGTKKSTQTFLYKVFQEPFGSWTSAPKIVDVHTKKCVFLRPRWWGETFWPRGVRA